MANQSLGYVTVTAAGTPVRLTSNETTPADRYPVHSYLIEVVSSNTGKIFVGSSTMNKATGAGVYAVLPPPTTNVYPSFSSNIVEAAAGFNLAEVYLDADVNGEKALVSVIIA